jgi:integrase
VPNRRLRPSPTRPLSHRASPVLPCLRDPLASAGLTRLYRSRGQGAPRALLLALPAPRRLGADTTVAEALRAGVGQHAILDSNAALGTVSSFRWAARHAASVAGHLPASSITEDTIDSARATLRARGAAPSSVAKVATVLRSLHRTWAEGHGEVPAVPRHPRRHRPQPVDGGPTREVWDFPEVAQLLMHLVDPSLQAIVALVVGSGLGVREVLQLPSDAAVTRGEIASVRRSVAVPGWAQPFVDAQQAWVLRAGAQWLFPRYDAPHLPRGPVNRVLQTAQRRAGGLGHRAPATLHVLRRTWTWWAWYAGLPQALRAGRPVRGPGWAQWLEKAAAWTTLCVTAGDIPQAIRGGLRRHYGVWVPASAVPAPDAPSGRSGMDADILGRLLFPRERLGDTGGVMRDVEGLMADTGGVMRDATVPAHGGFGGAESRTVTDEHFRCTSTSGRRLYRLSHT